MPFVWVTTQARNLLVTLCHMNGWVVRGLGLALVHAVVRTFLGAAVTQWPQQGSILRWFSLILVILAAFLWGAFDGIRDGAPTPIPTTPPTSR